MPTTEKPTSKFYFSRELDGVRRAIERVQSYEQSDWISDAYFQLWDIATLPDADLASLPRGAGERFFTTNSLRRGKLCRRLAVLSLYEDSIRAILQREQQYDAETPTLEELYVAATQEIMQMYEINADEVSAALPSVRTSY